MTTQRCAAEPGTSTAATAVCAGGGSLRVRRGLTLAAVALATATLMSACSEDGVPSDLTRPEAPAATTPADEPTPAPTEAPEPEPEPEPAPEPEPEPTAAPEEPVTSEAEGDGTTSDETIAIVLLVLAVLGVVVGLIVWLSRRSNGGGRDDEALRRRIASISGRARWVTDQGVPVLLTTTDPATLQSTWTTVSTTLVDLQQELHSVAGDVGAQGSAAVADLGTAIGSMHSSLDSGYQVRMRQSDDTELVATTDRSILAQRDQLLRAIQTFEMATA